MVESPSWEANSHSASQSQGYFATDGQSVLALSPSGTHNQIMAVVKAVAVLLSWGVLPDWQDGSVL
jgi:hypothetical protein